MSDVRPSVPRTQTQYVLRIVSIIMALLVMPTLVGGIVILAMDREDIEDPWQLVVFGAIIVAIAALLLITACLGIRASNDSSKVGPYRFLCYLVGLVNLFAIVWGWGVGTFMLFNPLVLSGTIVYVLICSTLADKVKEEHDAGIKGETFLMGRYQRALSLLSEFMVIEGAIAAVVSAVLIILVAAYGVGGEVEVSGTAVTISDTVVSVTVLFVIAAALNILVGSLGLWGSSRPEKILPFLVLLVIAFAFNVVRFVGSFVAPGIFGGISMSVIFDDVFEGACVYLSWKIYQQARATDVDESLLTSEEVTTEE